jgi:hypothetical protein
LELKYDLHIAQLAVFANDAAPEAIKDEADLLKQIFAINKEHRPISDPVKGTKGYYIFTVTKIEESKQQTLACSHRLIVD